MPATKFVAILPQKVQPGDRIRLKGTVVTNGEEFSINFANETCPGPLNITYHFKWLLQENVIVENYKDNGIWMEHRECEYNVLDGRLNGAKKSLNSAITQGFDTNIANHDSYSFLGPGFALEFAFQDDGIYVYLVEDGGHNLITHFEPFFELTDIKSVQVWGDVEKISELSFAYK